MSELDRIKDMLNNLRLYLGFLVAALLALGGGIVSVYRQPILLDLFWVGVGLFFLLSMLFVYIAFRLHKKTDELRDL
jgi:hypothetical protein